MPFSTDACSPFTPFKILRKSWTERVFFGKPLCQGTAIEEINEVIQPHYLAFNSFGTHVVKGFFYT
jgi:hypothetical protein